MVVTHSPTFRRALALAVVVAAAWPAPRAARACAPAPMAGQQVTIAGEEALIVWDAASRTQHFVRRASFRTAATDFGFLVPTPARPTLAEEPDQVFDTLARMTAPEHRYEHRTEGVRPTLSCLMFMLASRDGAVQTAAPPVRVLEERRVAGYDAAVLEADSPTALADWLRSHGYESRPTLAAWLAPYVAARWIVTAFRVAPRDAAAGPATSVGTSAVRMSFATERPFFPYREPADQRGPDAAGAGPRMLRVYVVADARMEGTLGANGAWPGAVKYARALPDLRGALGLAALAPWPAGAWLTAFEDASTPRPGTDEVYFRPATDRAPVTPPPVVVRSASPLTIPVDWVAIPLVVGWWIWRRARRRRGAGRAP